MSIQIHNDFLTGKSLDNLLDFSKSFSPENKRLWGLNDVVNLKNSDNQGVIDSVDKCILFLNKEFCSQNKLYNDLRIINIFGAALKPGEKYQRHADKHYYYDDKKESDIVYTGLLYLNDDYSGGELILEDQPEDKVAFKPTPGTLIYFTEDVFHEVLPITNGIRYNIVMFFSDTDLERPLAKFTISENF